MASPRPLLPLLLLLLLSLLLPPGALAAGRPLPGDTAVVPAGLPSTRPGRPGPGPAGRAADTVPWAAAAASSPQRSRNPLRGAVPPTAVADSAATTGAGPTPAAPVPSISAGRSLRQLPSWRQPGAVNEAADAFPDSGAAFRTADCDPDCMELCLDHPSLAVTYGYACPYLK